MPTLTLLSKGTPRSRSICPRDQDQRLIDLRTDASIGIRMRTLP
jgi:hypothetical protein